jgi:cytochrome P450
MTIAEALPGLLTPEVRADPYPLYAAVLDQGPVLALDPEYVVVVGYDAASSVLRDPRFLVVDDAALERRDPAFRDHPAMAWHARTMLAANPPRHLRLRRLFGSALTPRRVAAMRAEITGRVETLAEELVASGPEPVDFMAGFADRLPVDTVAALLGLPEGDRDWLRPRVHAVASALSIRLGDDLDAADRATAELIGYLRDLVEARRRTPGQDLVSALTQQCDADGDRLTADEVMANLGLLFVAGSETTVNLLGNGLAALLRHPTATAELRRQPDLAAAYVEEMLRYDPSVQVTWRWVAEPTELCGVPLARHAIVVVVVGAANRDPARFAEPATFDPLRYADPDRAVPAPLTFGGGAHFCFGAALARLQAQVAFATLVRRLPAMALTGEPTRRDLLALRGYATLPVTTGAGEGTPERVDALANVG